MSLDLVKNALFQRVTQDVPGLQFFPEQDWGSDPEAAGYQALLNFIEIDTKIDNSKCLQESLIATVNGVQTELPVIAYCETTWKLQLFQRPGDGYRIEDVREAAAKVWRFVATLRALDLGAAASLAEFWFEGHQQQSDEKTLAILDTWSQRVEWKLVDVVGLPVYDANTIQVYFNGELLVTVQ